MPGKGKNSSLPIRAREATLAAIATDVPVLSAPGPAAAAIALKAGLSDAVALTEGERRLLSEWLDRLAI